MSIFFDHVRAGFPALWLQTQEPARAMAEHTTETRKLGYKCFSWDHQAGIHEIGNDFDSATEAGDPIAALKFLKGQPKKSILFLCNFHKFIPNVEVFQELTNLVEPYKATGKTLVVLSPTGNIPPEVEKLFSIIRFDLPEKKDLLAVLKYMAQSSGKPLPDEAGVDRILESGKGLTAWEFENALALSIIVKKGFDPEIILDQKKQLVKKNASLILEDSDETLENLGGLENLKGFCLKVASSPLCKGVLLLGVPGTGKSHFSKALGKTLGLPTAGLDFGRLFAGHVGESEELARAAFDIVDQFAPCILRIDEIEKGLSGIKSSGETDGGTGSRVFSTFLNWLNDHKTRVFVIATCNDIQAMPPEFLRAERWDAIFFVDLPTEKEREVIFKLYQKAYQVKGTPPTMDGWSGAEIKSLCRIAAMMGTTIDEATRYIMPLSQSMNEKIEDLRKWARTRTIPASNPEPGTDGQIKGRRIEQ